MIILRFKNIMEKSNVTPLVPKDKKEKKKLIL
jgi:hypothetical protein